MLLVLALLLPATAAAPHKSAPPKPPTTVELLHPSLEGASLDPVEAARQVFQSLTEVVDTEVVVSRETRVVYGLGEESVTSALQAQVFLMASMVAATATDYDLLQDMEDYALELFAGWRRMCERSKHQQQMCQIVSNGGKRPFSCGDGWGWTSERYPCLPHRRWDKDLVRAVESGSDAAADADAILAMIVLVVRFEGANKPWWREVGQWAYDSCKAFVHYDTEVNEAGRERLVRLGSCRGGWECANPSYLSPAHYRIIRSFLVDFATIFNNEKHKLDGPRPMFEHARIEANNYASQFDTLISTSYKVLSAAQCSSTGLLVNWIVPDAADAAVAGRIDHVCRDKSPAPEFGVEAARVAWRLFLDYAWFQNPQAVARLRPLTLHVAEKLQHVDARCSEVSCNPEINLSPGCLVQSIFPSWTEEPFMTGPIAAAMMVPAQHDPRFQYQQAGLDLLARLIRYQLKLTVSDGFNAVGLAWAAMATLSLSDTNVHVESVPHLRQRLA